MKPLALLVISGLCFFPLHAFGGHEWVIYASDAEAGDMLGAAVAVGDDFIVAGAPKDNSIATDLVGEAYIFVPQGSNWIQQASFRASDGIDNDQFGTAVGACSGTIVVGATRLNDLAGGAAYVFIRQGTQWVQQAMLTHPGSFGWLFGEAVDIDGDWAVVGARTGDTNGLDCGTVHVFQRSGTNWSEQAMITPSDGASGDWFGHAVALSWPYLIVGADGRSNFAGGAYIFRCNSSNVWEQEAILNDPDAPDADFFGQWVDIDGKYAVVGTDHEQNGAYVYHREGTNWVMAGMVEDVHPRTGPGVGFYGDSGCLHGEYLFVGGDSYAILFQRNGTGWVKQIRVGNSDWDVSGTSVAVDPDWLVAGCPSDDSLLGNAGSLHVVSLNDRNRQSELIPTNTVQIRYIGSGLAVDGDMVLVGGRYGGSNDFGYVGVFAYNGTWWPVFQELIPSDATNSQQFGAAVDLCGQYALIGAPGDDELGEDSGAAYVFTLLFTGPGSNWVEQAKLLDTNLGANASLGAAVGTDGDYALVGAPDAGRGVVDIFSRSGTNWTLATTLTGTASSAQFGRALDYDGTRVIIGSPNETVGTNMGAGTAYIYRRDGASWTLESPAPITSTNPSELGEFGASVGIDRDWCVVGEPHYGLQIGDQFGAVHIFRRVASTWVPWQTLYSPQPQGTGYYGCAVAIAWPYIMVGASGEGWGYIYRLSADTNWVLLARIDGGDAEPGSNFGTTAALSEKYGLMGIAQEYSPKAYLFYAESFDLPPEITGMAMSNGMCVLEIDRLVPGFYTGVERADGALDGTWTRLEDFTTTCEKTNRNETPGSSGTAFFRALRW